MALRAAASLPSAISIHKDVKLPSFPFSLVIVVSFFEMGFSHPCANSCVFVALTGESICFIQRIDSLCLLCDDQGNAFLSPRLTAVLRNWVEIEAIF